MARADAGVRRPAGTVRGDIDWLWLTPRPEAGPSGSRARGPLALGGRTLRALLAPTSRTYAFHLQPPPGAALVFDYGSEGDTLFTVKAPAPTGEPASSSFRIAPRREGGERPSSTWAFCAGQAVRLELETEGSAPAGWGEPEIMLPRRAVSRLLPPSSRPRGVIVLVMDTARADAFTPFQLRTRVQTPAFDRLARTSAVFLNAYANENWTKPSVATILSGLYPSTHGAKREPDVLSKDVALLPEMLQRRGFATAAFIANGYCSDKFGFRRGWGTYRNYIRENRPSEAENVFSDALSWLKRTGAPLLPLPADHRSPRHLQPALSSTLASTILSRTTGLSAPRRRLRTGRHLAGETAGQCRRRPLDAGPV